MTAESSLAELDARSRGGSNFPVRCLISSRIGLSALPAGDTKRGFLIVGDKRCREDVVTVLPLFIRGDQPFAEFGNGRYLDCAETATGLRKSGSALKRVRNRVDSVGATAA